MDQPSQAATQQSTVTAIATSAASSFPTAIDPHSPLATRALFDRASRGIANFLQHFQTLVDLSRIPDSPVKGTGALPASDEAVNAALLRTCQMKAEQLALVSAAESLLSLSYQLRLLWRPAAGAEDGEEGVDTIGPTQQLLAVAAAAAAATNIKDE